MTIALANAFDVFAEWKRVSRKRVGRKVRCEVEVTLHNEKPQDVTVRFVQPFGARWSILASSHKFTKLDAFTAQWVVPVKAGKVAKVTFTADLMMTHKRKLLRHSPYRHSKIPTEKFGWA